MGVPIDGWGPFRAAQNAHLITRHDKLLVSDLTALLENERTRARVQLSSQDVESHSPGFQGSIRTTRGLLPK